LMSGCCPPHSWDSLANTKGYQDRGVEEEYNGLMLYRVGTGDKCVIWNYDIFGFDGGRTRQTCDMLSDRGFMVVIPDYFHGKSISPTQPGLVEFITVESQWKVLQTQFEQCVLPYARLHGAKVFGSVGTCWGSYNVIRQSGCCRDVKCGVSMHPSHSKMMEILEEKEERILKEVKCPQLYLSAGNDHPNSLPGGLAEQVLKDKLTIVPFPDMKHGWTIRGDMNVEAVHRDVIQAVTLMTEFFIKHVKVYSRKYPRGEKPGEEKPDQDNTEAPEEAE